MAQRFSKPFYNSKEWQTVREYVLKRDRYLCVQCGNPAEEVHHIERLTPSNITDINISLNDKNLISLCKECHFKEHESDKRYGNSIKNNKSDLKDEYMFNDQGYIVLINK